MQRPVPTKVVITQVEGNVVVRVYATNTQLGFFANQCVPTHMADMAKVRRSAAKHAKNLKVPLLDLTKGVL